MLSMNSSVLIIKSPPPSKEINIFSNNMTTKKIIYKYNFYVGHPSLTLLPNKEIIKATTELLTPKERPFDKDPDNLHPLNYGSDLGSKWVRSNITDLINSFYHNTSLTNPEFINLTNGASYGILNILELTACPIYTKQVFIISPTYFLINDIFVDAGYSGKLCSIKETEGGSSIDFKKLLNKLEILESQGVDNNNNNNNNANHRGTKIASDQQKHIYKYIMYLIPTFSNPSGSTYSTETRIKLIEIARKYDMLIISDDVYDMLNYDTDATKIPPRIVHLDRLTIQNHQKNSTFGNSISNCTFSKLIAPGLRCGYQETATSLLATCLSKGGANHSGGSPSQLNANIIGTLITNGDFQNILQNLKRTYSERCDVMYKSILKYLPPGTLYNKQLGGYFSWCVLPDEYNCKEICEICKYEFGVLLANGNDFEVYGDENKEGWGKNSVRLSCSYLESDEIENGIRLWGEACKMYINSKHK
ncbi:related to 2-aminoadipate transaminase [Saccharomycodes ludwigii]|uniref:Related to 2-aminoadipate transaminase n=1 Tax=Saccharomycodes ludwigii TaxID=36035 RepID=A0A376B7S6_9ASCO|nr:hypothetical protein SCDLUD_001634 [Saccharomycodes ludwigii]KAH3901851.1 hypothetical protein SCDLUD_001634 [Saccharomycodes ludwigii]SSD60629.1 related to 2-aminoadipate transaminase [Saccharomycodes ludwigii]